MKKSVYSLVLMDRLVQKVDQLAYENNTSRSNMANQILAEYLSMMTPKQRTEDMFGRMEELISACQGLQTTLNPSAHILSIKSVLAYKYNPTVRYSLALYPTSGETFGELRVLFRTQNERLLDTLGRFFAVWIETERTLRPGDHLIYKLGDGKMTRQLLAPPGAPHEALAEATVRYITLFDRAMKQYFAHRDEPDAARDALRDAYRAYLNAETLFL